MRNLQFLFLAVILFFHLVLYNYALSQSPCQPSESGLDLDVNSVRAHIPNGGNLWTKDINNDREAGYEVPKINPPGSSLAVHSLFSGALWIGGLDNGGQLKMAAQTYRQSGNDFWPGPLAANNTTNSTICNNYDRHWKVSSTDITIHASLIQQMGTGISRSLIPRSILEWPAKGNPYAMGANQVSLSITESLAPFVDVNNDGDYDPTVGDYPEIYGDQHIFWVFNDNGNTHSETGGEALGIEVHGNAYAVASNDVLDTTTFYKFKVIYKNSTSLNNVYMGLWVDGDLGCFNNDYVGCDTTRDMGIVYNGTAMDPDCGASRGYGNNPPLLGVKVLKGPDGANNVPLGMSGFHYYNNDFTVTGNPESAAHFYNYLTGFWKDNTSLTSDACNAYGGSIPTKYMFPSNPSLLPYPNFWSECSCGNVPEDRRFLMKLGPFTLDPGSVKTLDFAVVWTRPTGFACGDFNSTIGPVADQVQAHFDTMVYIVGAPCFLPDDPVITGEVSPVEEQAEVYTVPDQANYSYSWAVTGGTILSGQDVSTVTIQWATPGNGVISLVWADANGCIGDSSLAIQIQQSTGVEGRANFNEVIAIYPNPAQNKLYVEIVEPTEIRVSNILGEEVLLKSMNVAGRLDISGLTPGVYFIYDHERSAISKFVKE